MLFYLFFACQIETPVLSDSVAPLEENTAPDPTGDTLSLVSGTSDAYGWVHAKAILPSQVYNPREGKMACYPQPTAPFPPLDTICLTYTFAII